MNYRFGPFLVFAFAVLSVVTASSSVLAEDDKLTFERDIRPIFRAHCFDCHGAEKEVKGKLDLRLVRFMLAGGESGPAIVAGDADASYLVERVRAGEMPPGNHRVPVIKSRCLYSGSSKELKQFAPNLQASDPDWVSLMKSEVIGHLNH